MTPYQRWLRSSSGFLRGFVLIVRPSSVGWTVALPDSMVALPDNVVKRDLRAGSGRFGAGPLGAGALDDGKADVDHPLGDRAALGAIDDEPCGLPADAGAVDADGGERRCVSAAKAKSPKPKTASRPGIGMSRACASVITPSASVSELQNTASISGRRASSSARPLRPWPSALGAGTTQTGTSGLPRRAEAWTKPSRRTPARGSSAVTIATRRTPFACRYSATAAPTFSWEKPTSMSIGVGVRSQVSTTGMPAASKRRRPSAECMIPVSTMPSGRRPMIASSSASSRELA